MSTLNKVILLGRLGKDPEVKYTQTQLAVASFSLATSEVTSKDDVKNEKTEWHNIVVWGKAAENCSQFLRKGSMALIEGKLSTRSWEDKQGNKRYTTEIIASNVQFLTPKKEVEEKGEPSLPQTSGLGIDDLGDIPF